MKDWLTEWLIVFPYSTGAQLALAMGVVLSLLVLIVGNLIATDLVLDGYLAPLTDTFRVLIDDRCNGTAMAI